MIKYLLVLNLIGISASAFGVLAGGRPNTFSEGNNAFAGTVNPANAVWIGDRFDLGAFLVHQKSTLNNKDDNPNFLPGKANYTYKCRNLFTTDAAIQKQFKWGSFSLATYTMPAHLKIATKNPVPISGTTPIKVHNRTDVISAIFSFKINASQSLGVSLDYFNFSHKRNGFQNSDNPQRSIAPGHVTNNGTDHSGGFGCSVGFRWKITERLNFGTAWVRKSYCGQYRRYRGFEPHHAHNFVPQTVGGGFSYLFSKKLAGRLEMIWSNFGNLPNANSSILPDGTLNPNKRGSNKSPGAGLQDATFLNLGLGYRINSMVSLGAGFSHRIKLNRNSPYIISHSYMIQTIYELLSLGANIKYKHNDFFIVFSKGFKNRVSGYMPPQLGGGKFVGERETTSLSISWGYFWN